MCVKSDENCPTLIVETCNVSIDGIEPCTDEIKYIKHFIIGISDAKSQCSKEDAAVT